MLELRDIVRTELTYRNQLPYIKAGDLASFPLKKETGNGFGLWDSSRVNINCSDILSLLIRQAGKICKRYASDLFIDWENVERFLRQKEIGYKRFVFGFRDYGVDHASSVEVKINNPGMYGPIDEIYDALYTLDIFIDFKEGVPETEMILGSVFEKRSVSESC